MHVAENIDAFSKLKFESDFQKLSPGGAISYVEVPNMSQNIEAVISIMKYIYENIMYAEFILAVLLFQYKEIRYLYGYHRGKYWAYKI